MGRKAGRVKSVAVGAPVGEEVTVENLQPAAVLRKFKVYNI